jgi:flagellar protein FlbD
MIVVTRLNDSRFAVNPDLIERIHETPDTTLIMVDGAKYIVTEPMAVVIEMIARYRARIVSLAYDAPAPATQPLGSRTSTGPQLGIVRGSRGAASTGSEGGGGLVSALRPAEQAPATSATTAPAPTGAR